MGSTVSMVFATLVMLVDGVLYIGIGMVMLSPQGHGVTRWFRGRVSELPQALLKRNRAVGVLSKRQDGAEPSCDDDDDAEAPCCSEADHHPQAAAGGELDMRLMAYILIILGLCRLTTAFYWGCGYVALGLGSCLAEICMLCHELLRHESVCTQRAVGLVLLNSAVSLLYIGLALPHCR